MKNFFNSSDVSEITKRIESLTPDSQKQWGKMNATQMLAHCNISLETSWPPFKTIRGLAFPIIKQLLAYAWKRIFETRKYLSIIIS